MFSSEGLFPSVYRIWRLIDDAVVYAYNRKVEQYYICDTTLEIIVILIR